MSSGGIRHDFTVDENLTPGEDRTLRYVIVDSAGVNVANFTGYSDFIWSLFQRQEDAGATAAIRASRAILQKSGASITTSAAPNCDVALLNTDVIPVATLYHELWATVSTRVVRLSYGRIVFIH